MDAVGWQVIWGVKRSVIFHILNKASDVPTGYAAAEQLPYGTFWKYSMITDGHPTITARTCVIDYEIQALWHLDYFIIREFHNFTLDRHNLFIEENT